MESAGTQDKYRLLLDCLSDIVLVLQDERVLFANAAATRTLGYTELELSTSPFLAFIHREDQNRLSGFCTTPGAKESPAACRLRFVRKSGEMVWLEPIHAATLEWEGRQAQLFCWRNIARAGREESEWVEAARSATMEVVVSSVVHEINNANGAIRAGIEIMQSMFQRMIPVLDQHVVDYGDFALGSASYSEFRGDIHEMLDGMGHGSSRIAVMAEGLCEYARQNPLEMTDGVLVNGIVQRAVDLLSSVVRKCIRHFEVTYADGLPALFGSSRHLQLVVVSALLSACHATAGADGSIRVETRFDQACRSVVIDIHDRRRDIGAQQPARLADASAAAGRRPDGTRLPLEVSALILEKHKGRMEFKSRPGDGTTLSIIIPERHVDERNTPTD